MGPTPDSPDGPAQIFDRRAVRAHRDRAARAFKRHGFLFHEVASRLAERLSDFNRSFPVALDLGCHDGALAHAISSTGVRRQRGIDTLVQADGAFRLVRQAPEPRVVVDEEVLPFGDKSLDLVMSGLSLHWVNDVPGALIQINRALRPDGLFLGAVLGGETLTELRQAFEAAEAEVEGGISPRVSPFIDVREAGSLLQRAGFAMPVTDIETLDVSYPDPVALMHELRGMGETNALSARRKTLTRRATLQRAEEIYVERFRTKNGHVHATFDIVFMTGWAPDESQPKPLRPGSATARLADALGAQEHPAGEKAPGGPRKP